MGLFKKKESYDMVLINGHIYTQDINMPWASCVSVIGNRIAKVGDYSIIEEGITLDTLVIDLDNKYVFPGFIDTHRSHVKKAFSELYLDLSEANSIEKIVELVKEYINNTDTNTIFGYGFKKSIFNDFDKDNNPLDTIETDLPIVLLANDNVSIILNKVASDIVKTTAEEEVVPVISRDYILNLLLPFEFDEINYLVNEELESLVDYGYTSILNLGTVDFLENFYKDSIIGMYNDEIYKVRMFTSFNLTAPLVTKYLEYKLQERRTSCLELDGFIKAENLEVVLDNFSDDKELLIDDLLSASERKYNIYITSKTKEDLILAYELVDAIRGKGHKNEIIIASNETLTKEELKDNMYYEDCITTWYPNYMDKKSVTNNVENVSDAIDELTVYGAEFLGERENLGSIEVGKLADFSIFSENLLELPLNKLEKTEADMTIINGKVAHDIDLENDEDLYNMMLETQM